MNKQQEWHIKVALIHVLVIQLTTEQKKDQEGDGKSSATVLPEQIRKFQSMYTIEKKKAQWTT
jgi:hypothetical protein